MGPQRRNEALKSSGYLGGSTEVYTKVGIVEVAVKPISRLRPKISGEFARVEYPFFFLLFPVCILNVSRFINFACFSWVVEMFQSRAGLIPFPVHNLLSDISPVVILFCPFSREE